MQEFRICLRVGKGPLPCQGSGCLGHVGVKLAMPEARNGTLCREATKAAIHIVATLKNQTLAGSSGSGTP